MHSCPPNALRRDEKRGENSHRKKRRNVKETQTRRQEEEAWRLERTALKRSASSFAPCSTAIVRTTLRSYVSCPARGKFYSLTRARIESCVSASLARSQKQCVFTLDAHQNSPTPAVVDADVTRVCKEETPEQVVLLLWRELRQTRKSLLSDGFEELLINV